MIKLFMIKAPDHIAFIMDGNSSWAKANSMRVMDGYQKGLDNLINIIQALNKHGVKYASFYAFSTENWNRPNEWLSSFLGLIKLFIKNRDNFNKLRQIGAKINVIGDISRFDADLRKTILDFVSDTKDHNGIVVNLALSYGARDEIVRAAKALQHTDIEITGDVFEQYLDTAGIPDPDLLIRTSSKMRLSNFMLWQLSYSELYFSSKLWPEFGESDLIAAINEFNSRKRTYGKF